MIVLNVEFGRECSLGEVNLRLPILLTELFLCFKTMFPEREG